MQIVNNYRDDEKLRASFNELAGKVLGGLNFEGWYRNGFWKDNYIPYSVVEDDRVVANVSVNICDTVYDGRLVHLFQIGTVMTDPSCRGKGYARILMERVINDYKDRADGFYLFANDSAVTFYPKFGFAERKEYQYSKAIAEGESPAGGADEEDVRRAAAEGECLAGDLCVKVECSADVSGTECNSLTGDQDAGRTAVRIPMAQTRDWDRMVRILNESTQPSRLYMVSNPGLYMFYLSQFMQENVFFIPDCDLNAGSAGALAGRDTYFADGGCYAVAGIEDGTLILHAIFRKAGLADETGNGNAASGDKSGAGIDEPAGEAGDPCVMHPCKADIDHVISAFGSDIRNVILKFTPLCTDGYEKSEVFEEDTHLLVMGRFFEENAADSFMFMPITHA